MNVRSKEIRDKVLVLIYQALDDIHEDAGEPIQKTSETVLLGPSSELDSLKLVNLIVAVEHRVEEGFGLALSAIANEKAMSQKASPLRSVGTLADFITEVLLGVGK